MQTNKAVKCVFIGIGVIAICIIAQLLVPSFDSSYKEKIKYQELGATIREIALCYIMTVNDNKAISPDKMETYATKIKPINNSRDIKFLFRKKYPEKEDDIIILAINPNIGEKVIAITFNNSIISSTEINIDFSNFESFPNNWPEPNVPNYSLNH